MEQSQIDDGVRFAKTALEGIQQGQKTYDLGSIRTTKNYLDTPDADTTMAAKKPTNWKLWSKVILGGTAVAVGGPAFTMWLTPTEEELRAKYNPELRKKSLENQEERQQEFDDFVTRLKHYSKSDKPIWVVVKEEEERKRKREAEANKAYQKETDDRRAEIRKEAGLEAK